MPNGSIGRSKQALLPEERGNGVKQQSGSTKAAGKNRLKGD
jgi:hypothetical protein